MNAINQGNSGEGLYNPQNQQPEMGSIFGGVVTPQQAPVAEVKEEPAVEETKEDKPAGKGCPNCHEMVTGKFCGNCGKKIEE